MDISLSTTNSVTDALQNGQARLQRVSDSPALDAELLLGHILGVERSWLLAHPEAALGPNQAQAWKKALRRLETGEALPYILGEWEFYGLKLELSPDVLIPRPETELLVETALDWLASHPQHRRTLDVGTGSGCIALALAFHCPDLEITASDLSSPALNVAARNLVRYDLADHAKLIQADLLAGLSGPFDLICANLPYIPTGRLASLDVARREPYLALDGGPDGLTLIRRLLAQAPACLAPGGLLLAEIDASQATSAPLLAQAAWPAAQVAVREDLAGLPRLLVVQT